MTQGHTKQVLHSNNKVLGGNLDNLSHINKLNGS